MFLTDADRLLRLFKFRCRDAKKFVGTKMGSRLFLACVAVFILLFFAPLFHGSVGAALIANVASPYAVLIWRRYDKKTAVVPAVFFCAPMIIDMVLYMSLSVATCLVVAVVATLFVSFHKSFSFFDKIDDTMYAFLVAGGVCVFIVIVASLMTVLVSVVWWLFCLIAFLAIVAFFFTVVLSTAAYTATDDKRQARKKYLEQQRSFDRNTYDADFSSDDEE